MFGFSPWDILVGTGQTSSENQDLRKGPKPENPKTEGGERRKKGRTPVLI